MYQGFFYKLMYDGMSPVKNLVSENRERLIEKLTEIANEHINKHYDVKREWREGMPHNPLMDVYFMECDVVYKNNPKLKAQFIVNVVPVDVV